MSERVIERDESGREIVYVSGKDIPTLDISGRSISIIWSRKDRWRKR